MTVTFVFASRSARDWQPPTSTLARTDAASAGWVRARLYMEVQF